jgi:hypothetical protein
MKSLEWIRHENEFISQAHNRFKEMKGWVSDSIGDPAVDSVGVFLSSFLEATQERASTDSTFRDAILSIVNACADSEHQRDEDTSKRLPRPKMKM